MNISFRRKVQILDVDEQRVLVDLRDTWIESDKVTKHPDRHIFVCEKDKFYAHEEDFRNPQLVMSHHFNAWQVEPKMPAFAQKLLSTEDWVCLDAKSEALVKSGILTRPKAKAAYSHRWAGNPKYKLYSWNKYTNVLKSIDGDYLSGPYCLTLPKGYLTSENRAREILMEKAIPMKAGVPAVMSDDDEGVFIAYFNPNEEGLKLLEEEGCYEDYAILRAAVKTMPELHNIMF